MRCILHVEDNEGDARLLSEALSDLHEDVSSRAVANAVSALLVLTQRADYACVPTPDLVILDLNLGGGLDGMATLAIVRRGWPNIPAVMLSSSTEPATREEALALGAAAYLVKPMRWEEYPELARMLVALMRPPHQPTAGESSAGTARPRQPVR